MGIRTLFLVRAIFCEFLLRMNVQTVCKRGLAVWLASETMNVELKRWVGRGCWGFIAVFFGWVAVCAARVAETMMMPGLPSSGGVFVLNSSASVGAPLFGLLNWGVPAAALALGTLAFLARQRLVPVERVVVTTSAVLAVTLVVVTLGSSFCRDVLGTASLAQSVWWLFQV